MSRRATGRHYEISESVAIKWLERFERHGSREPVGHGGHRPRDDDSNNSQPALGYTPRFLQTRKGSPVSVYTLLPDKLDIAPIERIVSGSWRPL
jgi:hypothetical protein